MNGTLTALVVIAALVLSGCSEQTFTVEQEILYKDYFGTTSERVVFEEDSDGVRVLEGNATPILRGNLELPSIDEFTKVLEPAEGVQCRHSFGPTKAIVACTEKNALAYYYRSDRQGNHHGTELYWHVQGTWEPPLYDECTHVWCRVERAAELR